MFRILLICAFFATQAHSGAWPREKGTTFFSFSVEAEQPGAYGRIKTFSTLYAEYGLTNRLTLGVDAGGDRRRMAKAIAFVRVPLGAPARKTKLAVELGAGRISGSTALRPGVSVGRGYRLGHLYGWAAIDTRFNLTDDSYKRSVEADLTLGLNTTEKSKLILQMQTGKPTTSHSYAKLAPSLVYEIQPGRHIELGMTAGIKEISTLAIKLGFWGQF